jgi:hypothetical protein
VEISEKLVQLQLNTIHQCQERHHLCQLFVLKPLIKTKVRLYEKCSPILALQLWYSMFLQFCWKFLSNQRSNMCKAVLNHLVTPRTALERAAPTRARPPRGVPAASASGPSPHQPRLPKLHASQAFLGARAPRCVLSAHPPSPGPCRAVRRSRPHVSAASGPPSPFLFASTRREAAFKNHLAPLFARNYTPVFFPSSASAIGAATAKLAPPLTLSAVRPPLDPL